jgi:POT family proton-dependent oligopeptide transporter
MGVWLSSTGIANILSGQLAAFTQTLGYLEVFGLIGTIAIFFGFILLLISKKLVKMME